MPVDISIALAVGAVFLAAGFVKGIVGIGLPIFSVALLSHVLGIREAIYITLAPALLTSLAQAVAGPAFRVMMKRLWPLLTAGSICIAGAAYLSLKSDGSLIAIIVGSLIIIYSGAALINLRFPPPGRYENFLTPVIGAIGGTLGGMSGMFSMPAVPYMQTLGLNREELIQSIAFWFSTGALVMLAVHGINRSFTTQMTIMSAIAVITSLTGVWFGTKFRGRLAEGLFIKVFLVAFLILGMGIVYRAISGSF